VGSFVDDALVWKVFVKFLMAELAEHIAVLSEELNIPLCIAVGPHTREEIVLGFVMTIYSPLRLATGFASTGGCDLADVEDPPRKAILCPPGSEVLLVSKAVVCHAAQIHSDIRPTIVMLITAEMTIEAKTETTKSLKSSTSRRTMNISIVENVAHIAKKTFMGSI
jgi:hypothetical protein